MFPSTAVSWAETLVELAASCRIDSTLGATVRQDLWNCPNPTMASEPRRFSVNFGLVKESDNIEYMEHEEITCIKNSQHAGLVVSNYNGLTHPGWKNVIHWDCKWQLSNTYIISNLSKTFIYTMVIVLLTFSLYNAINVSKMATYMSVILTEFKPNTYMCDSNMNFLRLWNIVSHLLFIFCWERGRVWNVVHVLKHRVSHICVHDPVPSIITK